MLTAAEYDRLPGILRRIVDADRSNAPWLNAIREPVITFNVAKAVGRRLQHRRALSAEADKLYGHRLAGTGPATV
ncbi:hypothetical protein [uncultured Methylobacterium sp.]|uniref:hypothetical protein n=1 Tax=uncultured Methylobacterium sp. TaxID=157278 RepID=UPI0035C96F29